MAHISNATYRLNDLMLHTKTQNFIGALVLEKNILRVLPYMGRGYESQFFSQVAWIKLSHL